MQKVVDHPLLAHIPAEELAGELLQAIPIGAGLVTVVATPDSEWGSHEVTAWRPATQAELDEDLCEFHEPGPAARYTLASTLQDEGEIAGKVEQATAFLTARLAELFPVRTEKP